MIKTIKENWIQALRSGKYNQIKRLLKTNEGYCCLGVLNEINGHPTNGCFPSRGQLEMYELSNGHANLLTKMNDNGASFLEIADYIEKNL